MLQRIIWKAVSQGERVEIIDKVKTSISSSNGYITNFNMFSDLAIALSIEIPEKQIISLHESLSEILTISEIDPQIEIGSSQKDWLVYMNISFSKGTGDLRIEVPAVPG